MMALVVVKLTEDEIREAIAYYAEHKLNSIPINSNDVHVQVKSKQNWRSEWEDAAFKAEFTARQYDGGW